MNPFYFAAALCALVVPVLFLVLPASYALVYALFPGAMAIIFVSLPGLWDYLTDGGRPPQKPDWNIPLGYKAAFVCILALPALWFLFPNSVWAPVIGVYAFILGLIFVAISDFRRRKNR